MSNPLLENDTMDLYDALDASKISHKQEVYKRYNLSDEQIGIAEMVLRGTSLFYTGRAGTGKSHLLQAIIELLPQISTFVTGTTGMAALRIKGTTVHSFAGVGLAKASAEDLLKKIGRQAYSNWQWCKTLIIDECSMMAADFFEKLEYIARKLKGNDRGFGGIQLVLVGDFFQAPPVNKKIYKDDPDVKYLFEASSLPSCKLKFMELTQIFRQKDTRLIDLLNDARVGELSSKSIALLDYLNRPLIFDDGIQPTKLYATNLGVNISNNEELEKLSGPSEDFEAIDQGTEPWKGKMSEHCIADELLQLKVGAQVMLLANDPVDKSLVNGSRCIVTRFEANLDSKQNFPVVRFINGVEKRIEWNVWSLEDRKGKVLASRTQIPLKLAYAMTIHKGQGMSIDRLDVKIDDAFDYGLAYVALSRATSIEGLRVSAYNIKKFMVNPKVLIFYRVIFGPKKPKQIKEAETKEKEEA